MSINFPNSLDSFTNPTGTSLLTSPDHAVQHSDKNDAIEALEAKVGVTSSTVTSSHDYKIASINQMNALNVKDYGAKGDGATDDTTSIQSAITASVLVGKSVYFPVGKYYTTGVLTLPANTKLIGETPGPFEVTEATLALRGSSFLITNSSSSFITIQGANVTIEDMIFFYPNQVEPTAATPTSYPATIIDSAGDMVGFNMRRCTAINPYTFISFQTTGAAHGRAIIEDTKIGRINIGIILDHVYDVFKLKNIIFTCIYNPFFGLSYPQNLDTWIDANSYAIQLKRVDNFIMEDIFIYKGYTGILFVDSSDSSITPKVPYGVITDLNLDGQIYGIDQRVSNSNVGVTINNLIANCLGTGSIVYLKAGGSFAPSLTIDSGYFYGVHPFIKQEVGDFRMSNIRINNENTINYAIVSTGGNYIGIFNNNWVNSAGNNAISIGTAVLSSVLIGNRLNGGTVSNSAGTTLVSNLAG